MRLSTDAIPRGSASYTLTTHHTMTDEFIDDQPPIGTLTPEARESLRLAMADTPPTHPDKLTP